ncbi:YaaR family protein [Clostridiaceae bacterium HSG29]|nr:YaaR family protein [Clostridiaceae bacterium HSG29]
MRVKKTSGIKSKGKVKSKKIHDEDVNRISFTEILASTKEENMREALTDVLEKINEKGKELINNRTVDNLLEYKKMVKNFIEDAVDFGLKINARRGYGLSGRTKILRTVSTIDKRLVELTDIIMKQESKGIRLLEKVGQIEGLLVNIFV